MLSMALHLRDQNLSLREHDEATAAVAARRTTDRRLILAGVIAAQIAGAYECNDHCAEGRAHERKSLGCVAHEPSMEAASDIRRRLLNDRRLLIAKPGRDRPCLASTNSP